MTQKQATPYPLRMPPELRAEIESLAKEHGRSLNAEIIAILSESTSEFGGKKNVKIVLLPKQQRVITGTFTHLIDVDFKQKMPNLIKDINRLIPVMAGIDNTESSESIEIYQGHNHFEVVSKKNSNLGWLMVQDIY